MIFWGMGISQHVHGTDNARCLIALALITGHVGRPGTGLHPLRGQNNVQGASDAGLIPMVFPDYQSVDDGKIRAASRSFWGTDAGSRSRGLTVVEIMDAIHAGEIKGMYIMGENPAMSDPDANHARAALAKLEHLVVQDIFLTETAGTPTWSCRPPPGRRRTAPSPTPTARSRWGRKALAAAGRGAPGLVDHPGDGRASASTGTTAIRRRLRRDEPQVMPSLDNITWERLEREDAVTYPCDAPDQPGNEIIFGDGFPTADGRGKHRAGRHRPAGRAAGRRLSDGADHRPAAGALAHRRHDPARAVLDALEPEAVAVAVPRRPRRLGIAPGDR